MKPELPFSGRCVLVTGGSRGIGRSIALAFAQAGADIAVSYRSTESAARSLVDEVHRLGRKAFAYPSDAANREDVRRLLESAQADLHRVDVLVANAGIGSGTNWKHLTVEEWRQVVETDLYGVLWTVVAAAPELKRTRGNAVLIASISGLLAIPWFPAYATAKAGVLSLTKSLALGMAPEVRVNAVAPGTVRTDMTADWYANHEFRESMERGHPLRHWGEPTDVANAALFLASDGARFITGETLVVDGGYTVGWWMRTTQE